MVIYVSILGSILGFMVRNMGIYSLNKLLLRYNLRSFLCLI
jgi:hypothetical protein